MSGHSVEIDCFEMSAFGKRKPWCASGRDEYDDWWAFVNQPPKGKGKGKGGQSDGGAHGGWSVWLEGRILRCCHRSETHVNRTTVIRCQNAV